jgi:hypothetical protein
LGALLPWAGRSAYPLSGSVLIDADAPETIFHLEVDRFPLNTAGAGILNDLEPPRQVVVNNVRNKIAVSPLSRQSVSQRLLADRPLVVALENSVLDQLGL